jgi:hypothetical protein
MRLVAVLLLLLILPARANLGDSVADCVHRYGKPLTYAEASAKNPFGTLVFVAGPYQLIVFLFNNVEVGARVSKKDKSPFNADELKTIMNADATTPWVPAHSTDSGTRQWVRGDKATAVYDQDKKLVIFTLPEMVAELHAVESAGPAGTAGTNTAPAVAPPRPQGNFAPAAPTQWTAPNAAPTNAPATNAPSP